MTQTDSTLGTRFSFRKTMTVAEQAMFTGISGNMGGQYVDAGQARKAAGMPNMVAFELAIASLLTTALARLGGPARRIEGLTLSFPAALAVGATVQAEAEIEGIEGESMHCRLRCLHVESGDTVVEGSARLVPYGAQG